MSNALKQFATALSATWQRISGSRKLVAVGAVVGGLVVVTAGGAWATRAASNQFASATISKLGGDNPEAVLDSIADRVVKQLMSSDGPLGDASKDLTDKLGKVADKKLEGIDSDSLVDKVSDEVVAAGMGKLNGISTDAIVQQVTDALIERALADVAELDLQALASGTLDDAVDDLLATVDLERIIKEYLAQIDVEAIARDAIKEEMGAGAGGLLGSLFFRN